MITSPGHLLLLVLSSTLTFNSVSAYPTSLSKRASGLTRGAAAGLGIGIAVASILLVGVITLLAIHFRSQSRAKPGVKRTRGVAAREKHHSTATTITNDNATPRAHSTEPQINTKSFESQPQQSTQGLPRRSKSIKDRLMGPLYQGSQDSMMTTPVPAYVRQSRIAEGGSTEEVEMTDKELNAEYERVREAGNRSAVPSYSSRRATRLMMMM